MQAVVCKKLGNPTLPLGSGVLDLVDYWPVPGCGPRGVRISVISTGMNFADALMTQGLYQERPQLPFVTGFEIYGVVMEVGKRVQGFKPGDKVIAVATAGGFAEQCVVDRAGVFKVTGRGDPSLCGLPVAFGTAHVALVHRANLKSTDTVLILGAAGGVGLAALQICKVLGATVVAVARGEEKANLLRDSGADVVIDSGQCADAKSLVKKMKAATAGGVDVIVDVVGGDMFNASLKCIKWGGRVLLLGFASGGIPTVSASAALVKNLTVHGVYWGAYMQHDPYVLQESMKLLLSWWNSAKIHVHVSHRVPLERIEEGFKAITRRQVKGKVIVMVGKQAKL